MPHRPLAAVASAALLTFAISACSSMTEFEYTCHDLGRSVTEGPLLERVETLASTTDVHLLDSCDSGDPLHVVFEAADIKKVMAELKAAGCRLKPVDESVDDAGNVVRCDFEFGETEFWVSANPTEGHLAQLVVPN